LKLVAVACYSGDPPPKLAEACKKFVELFAKKCGRGCALLLGGYWGAMKVVADEALKLGVPVVILPPLEEEDAEFPSGALVLRTGASYRVRSVFIARSCDALVALGGAAGTVQEAVTAYTEGRPVLVLKSGMDSDKLELLAPYVDSRATSRLDVFDSVEELVDRLCSILSSSEARPRPKRGG